ncbi:MAG: ABC transporter permease [Chloroflexota bacterium]
MRQVLAVARYEYAMGVRRWGMWVAFALAGLPYIINAPSESRGLVAPGTDPRPIVATMAIMLNVLMPLVGGIVLADRLARDQRLGVRELLWATPLSRAGYVLGKYAGGLLMVLTPVFVVWQLTLLLIVASGATAEILVTGLLAFLLVMAPAYAFVGAFSLACTAVLPVRVYQVLFTGYWFWGNFLSPEFLPTLAGTILTPSGIYAANGFFGSGIIAGQAEHSTPEAVLNLAILAACAGAALFALERYLAWQASRA